MEARSSVPLLVCMMLAVAGCAQDWQPRDPARGRTEIGGAPSLNAAVIANAAAHRELRSNGFARLADHGELVGYPGQPTIRRDGAYTWHRAELSEAHALAAIGDGSLRVTTPSGNVIDFAYERHQEHPSGDWTWVGRLEQGTTVDEIVLTFGDKAAFGTISQPGREPLRLTIRDGVSWLIESDAARLADMHRRVTPREPAGLVPPSSGSKRAATGVAGPTLASATSIGVTATSLSSVMDLVLGYTPGFAAMYGGASQAVTRLNHLVAIANQVHAHNPAAGRLRLVHALQVDHADHTSNGDTLEKLTGYDSSAGWITPDPAFSALRAARDRYGADLVSLVRVFNEPAHGGCGTAWLMGRGSQVDTGDAPFAYSVVGDGRDQDSKGRAYFCPDETLAHEIGRSLGLQYGNATAMDDGGVSGTAVAHSIGRETLATGAVAGPAWQAAAQFRAAPTAGRRARNDIDGDGRSDMVWFRPHDSRLAYWIMDGPVITRHGDVPGLEEWFFHAIGDLNGDGLADLIARRKYRDELHYFAGDGARFAERPFLALQPAGAYLAAVRDVDGDGKDDLLWDVYLGTNGITWLEYWIMDGPTIRRRERIEVGPKWRLQAFGDYNGDGRVDLIWNRDSGDMQFWTGDGARFASREYFTQYPYGWVLEGPGYDVDGDGKDDLMWSRRGNNSRLAYWIMDGPRIQRHGDIVVEPSPGFNSWFILFQGDYNGDGRVDLVWNRSWHDMNFWAGDGASFVRQGYFATFPSGWEPRFNR